MSTLTTKDIDRYAQRNRARRVALRDHIHEVLLESKREDFVELAGQVHDRGDEAVADLLTSTHLAALDREVKELREVEDALERIRVGAYGVCLACGEDIEPGRLDAYPSARHCVDCERRREVSQAGGRDQTPSL